MIDAAWIGTDDAALDSAFVAHTNGHGLHPVSAHQNEVGATAKAIVVGLRTAVAPSGGIITRIGSNQIDDKDIDCSAQEKDESRAFQQCTPVPHMITAQA